MTRKAKAKTLRILDEATMTHRTSHLYDVWFQMRDGTLKEVQLYAESDGTVIDTANRLFSRKGAFLHPIGDFNRA